MGLLLANHDRGLEMNVKDDEQFVVTRLEEEMLDVAEQNICCRVVNYQAYTDPLPSTYRSSANRAVTGNGDHSDVSRARQATACRPAQDEQRPQAT